MFATIFFACTYAGCNGYVVDTAKTESDCYTNLVAHSDSLAEVWAVKRSADPLQKWLDKFKTTESADELIDYDFTCEKVEDQDIP